jgi:hypothetical protein
MPLDLSKTIDALRAEVLRVNAAIAALQAVENERVEIPNVRNRRGRKSMSAEERHQVSARMRAYWNGRKNRKPALTRSATSSEGSPAI